MVLELHHQHLPYQVVLVEVEVETLPVEVLETLEDLLNQKEIQVVMVDILLIRHNMMVAVEAAQVVQEQLHQDKEVDQEELVHLFLLQVLILIMLEVVAVVLVEDLQQLEEMEELEEVVQEHQDQLDNQELQELIPQVMVEEEVLRAIVVLVVMVVPESL